MIVEQEFDFKGKLREIRLARGLTQAQLADMIGTTSGSVSNWEMPSGKSMPDLKTVRRICLALNCPPGDLLCLSSVSITGDEYNLLKGFRSLDDAGRHTMMAVLESQLAVRSGSDG